ncbi:hypothetical protein, partial [Flavobacterium sp. FlaQc-28]|uniref:hypothetical protein n=1 Tax=Flavobacterium sp. FlaQc-28 TaxID=3374178 RepID=UPI0037565188
KEVKSDVKNECGTEYTLTRTWTTSDCGGNSISYTQVITVRDTNTPIANVPVTLIPQGTTTGPILLRVTGADGMYSFTGMPAG